MRSSDGSPEDEGSDGWSDGQEMIVQMKAQKMRIQMAQMDGQMVRITQMKSSEDEDSESSDGGLRGLFR